MLSVGIVIPPVKEGFRSPSIHFTLAAVYHYYHYPSTTTDFQQKLWHFDHETNGRCSFPSFRHAIAPRKSAEPLEGSCSEAWQLIKHGMAISPIEMLGDVGRWGPHMDTTVDGGNPAPVSIWFIPL